MKLNAQTKESANNLTGKQAQGFVGGCRKALGTRVGILIDWREGSAKPAKILGRYGRALRDGR